MNSILILLLLLVNIPVYAQTGPWTELEPLNEKRLWHAVALLPDGKILVAGNEIGDRKSCEIYDAITDTWSYTAPMNVERSFHHLVPISDDKILAIGGYKEKSCEIFDYQTKSWNMTDSISTEIKFENRVVKLNDGRILMCGGSTINDTTKRNMFLTNCEIYDETTGKWSLAAPMNVGRKAHTLTLLKNGKVLVTGGFNHNGSINSCEIYDPDLNVWVETPNLIEKRTNHAAILLDDGTVFICSGSDLDSNSFDWIKSSEIYNPISESWELKTPIAEERENHKIFRTLDSNIILIAGGTSAGETYGDSFELYDIKNFQSISKYILEENVQMEDNIVQLNNSNVISIGGLVIDPPSEYVTKKCFLFNSIVTDIKNETLIENFNLSQNYPNPFNPSTSINFAIPSDGHVSIKVYNSIGKEVNHLVNGYKQAGNYTVTFDGSNLPSGVYFYKFESKNFMNLNKMTLIK